MCGNQASLISKLLKGDSKSKDLEALIRARLADVGSASTINRAVQAGKWLGVTSKTPVDSRPSVIESFCTLLEKKLQFKPNERDLVIMRHTFSVLWPGNNKEQRTSTLISYGDNQWSAMARTVGIPAAIGAKLLLEGTSYYIC